MTYDHDPARWTSSPEEAPELLRGAFAAARNESPSRAQARALAVKLAAASAGGAAAVGAVKVASAGNTVAGAASWSVAKIAGVVALAGSLVTGAVVLQQQQAAPGPAGPHGPAGLHGTARKTLGQDRPMDVSAPSGIEPTSAEGNPEQRVTASTGAAAVPAPIVDQLAVVAQAATEARPTSAALAMHRTEADPVGSTDSAGAPGAARGTKAARRPVQNETLKPTRMAAVSTSNQSASGEAGELQLLQSAQAALRVRPREAFQLTQRHRQLYPHGEFAQERDALAIQALMRAGETESARKLAEVFVRSFPESPHAHRFREAMGIR